MPVTAATGREGLTTARRYFAVTPSDTDELVTKAQGLLISVGGTLTVKDWDGNTVSTTVPAGFFPGCVKQVLSTGTAATGITAFV